MTRRNNALRRQKPVKNKPKRNKTGPKPVYIGRLHEVYQLALLGATNQNLADFFKVGLSTIEYWIRNYDDFREAKEKGGMIADARVADSMYKRAVGYKYEEKEYKNVPIKNKKGQITGWKEVLVKRVEKEMPPDTKAGFKWLPARQRSLWSEAGYMHIRHTHDGQVKHLHADLEELDMDSLSEAAKEVLFELNMQQLEQGKRNN